jgi:cell division septation protein DedD
MSMMLTFRAGKVAALMIFLSLAAACSREQQDWRSAEASDTVEGYGRFLERHPDSELATEAHTRIAQLAEDREWQRAASADSADAYRQFLGQHPNGKWAQEARIRIQNFALNGLPPDGRPVAESAGTAAVTNAPSAGPGTTTAVASPGELASAPAATQISPGEAVRAAPSDQASRGELAQAAAPGAPSPRTTGYAIQLGAFASESAANNEWQQLTARFGAQLRGLPPHVVPANTTTGPLFRLQAQVADEAQARTLCDMLRKQSQPCVPVLPH